MSSTQTPAGRSGSAAPSPGDRPGTIDAVPVRHPGRWVAIAVIAAIVFLVVRQLLTNPAFNWSFVW